MLLKEPMSLAIWPVLAKGSCKGLIIDFGDTIFLPDQKHNSEDRTFSLPRMLGAVAVATFLLAAYPAITEQLNSTLDPPIHGLVIL